MEGKNSFLLYCDLIHTVRKLKREQAGDLFMTILSYVNDEDPVIDDVIIDLVFEPIRQHLNRHEADWVNVKEQKSQAGRLGGIRSGASRRKQKEIIEAGEADRSSASLLEANEHVSVSVSVNDNVPVITKEKNTKEKSKSKKVQGAQEKLQADVELQKGIDNFVAFRKKVRKPMTERAIELLLIELERIAPGDTPMKIKSLEQSELRGWPGVYPYKDSTTFINSSNATTDRYNETAKKLADSSPAIYTGSGNEPTGK